MHPNRLLSVLSFAIIATTASAQAIDINGGSSWNGWNLRGQSTDQGIYGSGSTTGVYDIYTTSFLFNGQTVSGSPAFGGLHGAPMDLSGWNPGARILGVGVRTVSGFPVWSGSGPWAMSPFIHFDLDSNSYQAASTVGGTDGRTSSSTYAHAGDFNVQLNGDYNNLYRPSGIYRYTDNGSFWGGSGSFTNYGGSTPNHATTVWPHVRSFFNPSNGSWQVLFNLDTLQTNQGFGTIGNDFRIVTHLFDGGPGFNTTAAVLDVSVVPPAQLVDINGGNSWSGWQAVGDSQSTSWVRGSTNRTFNIYSTYFVLDALQVVSGVRLTDNVAGNGVDYTGDNAASLFADSWQVGDRIVGIGIQYVGATRGSTWFFHRDAGGANILPASSFGAGDGVSGFDVGDTSSYITNQASSGRGRVRQYSVWFGFSQNGSPEEGNYDTPYGTSPSLEMPVRSFTVLDAGSTQLSKSMQYFLNIDAVKRANGGATFGDANFNPNSRFAFWEGSGSGFTWQSFGLECGRKTYCECSSTAYCTAGTSLNGCVPTISGTGTPSTSATSGYNVSISGMDGVRFGGMFYGLGMASNPINASGGGSSFYCTTAPRQRLITPLPTTGGTGGACDGSLSVDLNTWISTHPLGLGSPFATGQVLYVQGFNRDNGNASKGLVLSDGLAVTLCP